MSINCLCGRPGCNENTTYPIAEDPEMTALVQRTQKLGLNSLSEIYELYIRKQEAAYLDLNFLNAIEHPRDLRLALSILNQVNNEYGNTLTGIVLPAGTTDVEIQDNVSLLAEIRYLTYLKIQDLVTSNFIKGISGFGVYNLRHLQRITCLDLSGCSMLDRFAISSLRLFPALSELSLASTPITNLEIELLFTNDLSMHPFECHQLALSFLNIQNCNINSQCVQAIIHSVNTLRKLIMPSGMVVERSAD